MNPGRLDASVSVQRYTETRSTNGSVSKSWSTLSTVWISTPEQLSGGESVLSQQLQVRAAYKSILRVGSGITTKDRIVFVTTTYEVTRIFNIKPRNMYQEMWLVEVSP